MASVKVPADSIPNDADDSDSSSCSENEANKANEENQDEDEDTDEEQEEDEEEQINVIEAPPRSKDRALLVLRRTPSKRTEEKRTFTVRNGRKRKLAASKENNDYDWGEDEDDEEDDVMQTILEREREQKQKPHSSNQLPLASTANTPSSFVPEQEQNDADTVQNETLYTKAFLWHLSKYRIFTMFSVLWLILVSSTFCVLPFFIMVPTATASIPCRITQLLPTYKPGRYLPPHNSTLDKWQYVVIQLEQMTAAANDQANALEEFVIEVDDSTAQVGRSGKCMRWIHGVDWMLERRGHLVAGFKGRQFSQQLISMVLYDLFMGGSTVLMLCSYVWLIARAVSLLCAETMKDLVAPGEYQEFIARFMPYIWHMKTL